MALGFGDQKLRSRAQRSLDLRQQGFGVGSLVDHGKGEREIGLLAEVVEARRRGDAPPVEIAADLPEAVALAKRQARPGDAILLSPACASYDMFTNYEQRGAAFVELVRGATHG